ncbi:hypothetical protein TIFTF001_013399 [Ficus carica]|uniref:Uncharacterized protein n=1 Tax=Ficus carica TaxID=3494 RepID=A0AA88APV1_FICCA|nr:hypothetical protein TIFTF001_013399 [Ficus carica]
MAWCRLKQSQSVFQNREVNVLSSFHSVQNGIPLPKEDQIPRLETLQHASRRLVAARFGKRAAEVKHLIPFSLLRSQLELLRNDEFEW